MYLLQNQYMSFMYAMIYGYLFDIKEIMAIKNNKISNILYRYYLFCCLSRVVNKWDQVYNMIDVQMDKIQITKISRTGENTAIIDSSMYKQNDFLKLGDIRDISSNMEPSDRMIDVVILNFEIIRKDSTNICLKNMVTKYKDLSEKYNNTLRNILIFNKIEYSDENMVRIKKFTRGKLNTWTKLIGPILDVHINKIINM